MKVERIGSNICLKCRSKISNDRLDNVLYLREKGYSQKQIGILLGVSGSRIGQMLSTNKILTEKRFVWAKGRIVAEENDCQIQIIRNLQVCCHILYRSAIQNNNQLLNYEQ